jgi:hypothetical protein
MKITLKHNDGTYFHRPKQPQTKLRPFAANLCYLGTAGLLSAVGWGFHVLERYSHMGPIHYLAFLPAIWELGLYGWHCFIKKDYVWVIIAVG